MAFWGAIAHEDPPPGGPMRALLRCPGHAGRPCVTNGKIPRCVERRAWRCAFGWSQCRGGGGSNIRQRTCTNGTTTRGRRLTLAASMEQLATHRDDPLDRCHRALRGGDGARQRPGASTSQGPDHPVGGFELSRGQWRKAALAGKRWRAVDKISWVGTAQK